MFAYLHLLPLHHLNFLNIFLIRCFLGNDSDEAQNAKLASRLKWKDAQKQKGSTKVQFLFSVQHKPTSQMQNHKYHQS